MPFYDQGWQYTTPYSIYTTGMAWRKDKVNLTPSWNMPWQGAPYKGKVAILDDYREGISLALLRAGNLGRQHDEHAPGSRPRARPSRSFRA